jgi:Ala-tRNA(Pro) deacylase
MAIPSRLAELFKTNKVSYQTQKHQTAYTAQEIAAASHVPGRQLAKCVLVMSDRGPALAVLPAVVRVDFKKLKTLLKAKKVSLASEADIKQAFPDVEVGAMPPFGHLYQVPTLVDTALTSCQEIICNAGSHTETISLPYRDFDRLARPVVGSFGMPVPGQAVAKKNSEESYEGEGPATSITPVTDSRSSVPRRIRRGGASR